RKVPAEATGWKNTLQHKQYTLQDERHEQAVTSHGRKQSSETTNQGAVAPQQQPGSEQKQETDGGQGAHMATQRLFTLAALLQGGRQAACRLQGRQQGRKQRYSKAPGQRLQQQKRCDPV